MNQIKQGLFEKFFFLPARNDRVLFFERMQLISLYSISILALITAAFNLPMDIRDGLFSTVMVTILFMCLILAGLISFWLTRNLNLSQWFMGAAILILMTNTIIDAGGRYGLGSLYFMAGFAVLYLLVNYSSGIILPVYYTLGMIIRLHIGHFHPDSLFNNPEIVSRFIIVLVLSGVLGVLASVSLHIVVKYISRLAFEDFVTGLPNRNKLQEMLRSRSVQSLQQEQPFSLLALRLLNFSRLNGFIGTNSGDKILQKISQRLQLILPGFIGRWSGSIFMSVLDEEDVSEVRKVCKQIMESLSETFHVNDNHVSAHFVIAVSRFPHDASHSTQLLSNVISLLDHTRRLAGDIVFYDEETLKKEEYRFLLRESMSQADLDEEFSLVYQPKIRLSDEACVGAEVLLRWNNKDLGTIPPDTFIPIAEETGFIKKITRWVIQKAFRDIQKVCAHYHTKKDKFNFAINLSVVDLNDPDFLVFLEQQKNTPGLSAACVEFELTERIQIDQDPQIQRCLSRINEMGFRIAIDDFGTGYSSLSYLDQMNAHNLKIDKSFIDQIEYRKDKANYPVVDAVISMGSSLGMEVTAEGVETRGQVDYLIQKGCDTVQGWYYAKAIPLEDFMRYLK